MRMKHKAMRSLRSILYIPRKSRSDAMRYMSVIKVHKYVVLRDSAVAIVICILYSLFPDKKIIRIAVRMPSIPRS